LAEGVAVGSQGMGSSQKRRWYVYKNGIRKERGLERKKPPIKRKLTTCTVSRWDGDGLDANKKQRCMNKEEKSRA